jgi:hypothetical protein
MSRNPGFTEASIERQLFEGLAAKPFTFSICDEYAIVTRSADLAIGQIFQCELPVAVKQLNL